MERASAPTMDVIREMAVYRSSSPVLSIHLRTDPREPANTAHTPGWLVALRNELRAIADAIDERGSRDERLAFRELRDRTESDIVGLSADDRGRGLSWFRTPDGELDRRVTLQLPPRRNEVRWDERPFVSPLVDVADRGRPAGLVLIGSETVRLLRWDGGRVEEPERSVYELEPGEWRDYSAYKMASPGAGVHGTTFDQRTEEWHRRFLTSAAEAIEKRAGELSFERVVLVGDSRNVSRFADALSSDRREQVVAEVEASLEWETPAAVAERLEPELFEAWSREARAVAERAIEAASEGGPGATGWPEVLGTLVERRVHHLVFTSGAPAPSLEGIPPFTLDALGNPTSELLVERAVEHAVATDALVTALPERDAEVLEPAGGVAAVLRY